MSEQIIEIKTYMYSNSGKQSIPMYEDGKLNKQLDLNYRCSFLQASMMDVEDASGFRLKRMNRISDYCQEEILEKGNDILILRYILSDEPAPYKEEDDMRNKLSTKLFDWFVHHVDINGHSEPNWIAAECYLCKLFS